MKKKEKKKSKKEVENVEKKKLKKKEVENVKEKQNQFYSWGHVDISQTFSGTAQRYAT